MPGVDWRICIAGKDAAYLSCSLPLNLAPEHSGCAPEPPQEKKLLLLGPGDGSKAEALALYARVLGAGLHPTAPPLVQPSDPEEKKVPAAPTVPRVARLLLPIDWEKELTLLGKQSFDGFPGPFQELIFSNDTFYYCS